MNIIKRIAIIVCVFLLVGCQNMPNDEKIKDNDDDFTSLEEELDLTYEVPISSPNILINQLGYISDASKVAIFRGERIAETFEVVNAATGEVVYTGITQHQGYNQEFDEYNSYGDFSELVKAGSYYIQTPMLGRSYPFMIGEHIYDDVFQEAFKQYYYNRCGMTLTEEYAGKAAHNACHTGKAILNENQGAGMDVTGGWHQNGKASKNVVEATETMAMMLLAYELYGASFTDNMNIPESGNKIPDILDEVRYEIDWMLKMQDEKTGGIYAGISSYEFDKLNAAKESGMLVEAIGVESSQAFAMILAKFCYLYQGYDTTYATICLQAADRAWRYAEKNNDKEMSTLGFAAAAELYRATGDQRYHNTIITYLNQFSTLEIKDDSMLQGCITYISTKQKVNVDLCEKLIKGVMLKAEKISTEARKCLYMTAGNVAQNNNKELLENAMYLTVVDHIITNHEYQTMIENHLHYFMGRNSKALSYIDNVGTNNYKEIDPALGIMNQFDSDSVFLFMLSEIRKVRILQ